MIVAVNPCGQCLCCRSGKRCANVLHLGAKDAAALARVNSLVGEFSGRAIRLRPESGPRSTKIAAAEPTVTVLCPRCGDDYEILGFVMDTLKLRGLGAPPCQGCKYGTERADLR